MNASPQPGAEFQLPIKDRADTASLAQLLAPGTAALRWTGEGERNLIARLGYQPVPEPPLQGRICTLCDRAAVVRLVRFDGVSVGRCRACGAAMVTMLDQPAASTDDQAARYEQDLLADKADLCWNLLLQHVPLAEMTSLLDVGCGAGHFLNRARGAGLYTAGQEIAPHAAAIALQQGHEVYCRSIAEASFPPGSTFDVVTMWDVLDHVAYPRRALEHARAALNPGGRLLLCAPLLGSFYDRMGLALHRLSGNRLNQMLRMAWSSERLFRYNPAGIKESLRALGFTKITITPLLLLSFPPDRYAGGAVLPGWTHNATLDRLISRTGAGLAKLFQLHNKLLVVATKGAGE